METLSHVEDKRHVTVFHHTELAHPHPVWVLMEAVSFFEGVVMTRPTGSVKSDYSLGLRIDPCGTFSVRTTSFERENFLS